VKKEVSIKELRVVESDLDGHHYSSVKIQYFPEAQKAPEITENVEVQKKKKKKKKKKAANPSTDFQQVVNRRKKGKGDEETKPEVKPAS